MAWELRFLFNSVLAACLICAVVDSQDSQPPGAPQTPEITEPKPKVVGGHPAESDRFPYILSLRAPIAKGGVSRLHCGAVLIDRHWALTAASCVERRLKGVPNPPIYGGSTSRDGPFPEISKSSEVFFPPEWVTSPHHLAGFDIALVKLPCPFDLPTISLPDPSGEIVEDDEVWVIGWGRTTPKGPFVDVLQALSLKIKDVSVCQQKITKNFTSSMICAEDTTGSVCHGDSGGPLLSKGKSYESDTLLGVVPGIIGECASFGVPVVFSSISSVRDWIDTTMKENSVEPRIGTKEGGGKPKSRRVSGKRIVEALKKGAAAQPSAAKLISKASVKNKGSAVLAATNISIKRGLVTEMATALLAAADLCADSDALEGPISKVLKLLDD